MPSSPSLTPPDIVPRGWIAAYLAFNFLAIATMLGAMAGLFGWVGKDTPPAEILAEAVGGLLLCCLFSATMTTLVVGKVKRDTQAGLDRYTGAGPLALVAPAYCQARDRYRHRPAGVLAVSSTHVTFLATRPQSVELDFSWPLVEVEAATRTGDRFGFVSRIFDLQGGLILTRQGASVTFSVVGCHRFHEEFGELWGAAQAAERSTDHERNLGTT
jgi:hypothetical protein